MADDEKPADAIRDNTRIGLLRLEDAHGCWEFDPKPDITPYEAVLLAAMWTKMVNAGRRLDWREYLTRTRCGRLIDISLGAEITEVCDLARHFKTID